MKIKQFLWVQGPTIICGCVIIFILIVTSQFKTESRIMVNKAAAVDAASKIYNIKSTAPEKAKFDFLNTQNDSIELAYTDILRGMYIINENMMYDFGRNSSFFGFFDSGNTYVQNYKYKIIVESNIPYVYIIDPSNFQMVWYKLIVVNDKISLLYEENNLLIELK